MRRLWRGIRLSGLSIGLLVPGAALLLLAVLGQWVAIGGNQVLRGAPWWVQPVLGAAGLLAIGGAVAAGREPARELRTARGFLGAPPRMPAPGRLVERPGLSAKVVAALRAGDGLVALTGTGGAGKTTLAAGACQDRRVRRRFRDGVTWLEAGAGQDPAGLLSVLARRLGVPESESGFTTVAQGRDTIAAALRGKRLLIGLDNVWDRGPLDALAGLAPGCAVVFSFEAAGIKPDIVCLSKSISGYGLPMALTLIRPDLDIWKPGEHNGTFRGINPAFVTGTAALRAYWQDTALEQATMAKGSRIAAALTALTRSVPGSAIRARGRGLAHGLAFNDGEQARKVSSAAFERGLLVETAGPRDEVLKLLPPLTVTDAELDQGLALLADAVHAVC